MNVQFYRRKRTCTFSLLCMELKYSLGMLCILRLEIKLICFGAEIKAVVIKVSLCL